jgi:hypothetical protein
VSQISPDPNIIALGIRQPWVELILRGLKTIEVRSQQTRIRGTIYLYAAKKTSDHPAARAAVAHHRLDLDRLPRGVIVGTVEIAESAPLEPTDAPAACLPPDALHGQYGWRLHAAHRFAEPLTIQFPPYGVWFYPWRRKAKS